jgi:membrane protease YdiL (CAAX protease family)
MSAPVRTAHAPATVRLAGSGIAVVAAVGCGVLAARPAVLAPSTEPATLLALVFAALFVIGVSAPLPHVGGINVRSARVVVAATAVGVLAFALGRVAIGGHAPAAATFSAIAANTLAAVAEEVWFRRLCYGLLAPAGPGFAVGVTAVLFAAVHVSTYGVTVLPLDLAAGALLGWQRAVTGSSTAPALTHMLANLFVLL